MKCYSFNIIMVLTCAKISDTISKGTEKITSSWIGVVNENRTSSCKQKYKNMIWKTVIITDLPAKYKFLGASKPYQSTFLALNFLGKHWTNCLSLPSPPPKELIKECP